MLSTASASMEDQVSTAEVMAYYCVQCESRVVGRSLLRSQKAAEPAAGSSTVAC